MTEVTAEVVREAPSIKQSTHCYGLQFLDLGAEHRAYIASINTANTGNTADSKASRTTTVAYGT